LIIFNSSHIFTAFKSSSSLLPEAIFGEFNDRAQLFIPFISVPSRRHAAKVVVAQHTINMFCSAVAHPATHACLVKSQIIRLCVRLCFSLTHDTLMSTTVELCKRVLQQNHRMFPDLLVLMYFQTNLLQGALSASIQNDSLAGELVNKINENSGNWFVLEILRM
jgi:hypothetical protein